MILQRIDMPTPNNSPHEDSDARAAILSIQGQEDKVKQGARDTLGQVVPILHVEINPTNVDPGTPAGIGNMKRVLSAILNDEENRIMAKDDVGNPVGVRNFNEIYPQ